MNTHQENVNPIQQRPNKGHLYYVRLKTHLGLFYKLGFTTLNSVQERLAYQGTGHEELIDEVLCFTYMEDAFDVETKLHAHFANKAILRYKEPYMPLYGNGQSELYSEDILKMDSMYMESQTKETNLNIKTFRIKHFGNTDNTNPDKIKTEEDIQQIILLIGPPFKWMMDGYHKILKFFTSDHEKARQMHISTLIERVQCAGISRDIERMVQRKLRRFGNSSTLQSEAMRAIAALKNKDLQAFEDIVDINLFAYNLAEAMTDDLVLSSDYMGIAKNCYLINLMDAMSEGHPRDLLIKPVEGTYKAILRHYVKSHRLLTENLIVPDDPIYYIHEDRPDNNFSTLSSYYGPRNFLDLFGREWTLPDKPVFTIGEEWIEFSVAVRNNTTEFEGLLIIRATLISRKKLALSFPNFLSLDEAACEQRAMYEDSIAP